MIAAIFHVILRVIGAFWVFRIIHQPEKKVEFIPAGSAGGGPRGAEHQVQQKKQAMINPQTNVKRVFAEGRTSEFAIPEQGEDFGQMSMLSSLSGGGMSGGLGGSGSGKGFGNGSGNGTGFGSGMPSGIKLFGMDLKVKSIGVVLDVSRSMTPQLEKVLNEVNQVAQGSPVILHVGCGIGTVSKRSEGRILPVTAPRDGFKEFWFLNQDIRYRGLAATNVTEKIDISGPVPQQAVYDLLATRPKTYFHNHGPTPTTGEALRASEFRDVEAVYWFADFQDPIDADAAETIRKTLIRRKQKLYIHAFKEGSFFNVALEELVAPTGGKKIAADKI